MPRPLIAVTDSPFPSLDPVKAALAKRDDALKRAADTLVGIFSKMKPDAAAAQLSALDDETA